MAQITAGSAIFPRLGALGVDYVFVNSGTDFPPIIEGLARAMADGQRLPRAIACPHEHAAMGMAHGVWLMTGRPQAVMLHTNVGLANGAIGAINAACEHVPMILMSGRTPVAEGGRFGARTVPIGWGQEMFDQAALVREACKWDYELRFPEQIGPVLDRAHAIAQSTPKGPVYLSLPREVLCEELPAEAVAAPPTLRPAGVAPDPAALRTAADWLASAQRPLVIAQRGCGSAAAFAAFGQWASDWAMPVASWWATHLAIATDHPCHVGADPGPYLADADVVLVVNALAPWWPDKHPLAPGAKVIQLGPDPLFARFPMRSFPADLAIAGETAAALPALIGAMADRPPGSTAEARRARLAARPVPAAPSPGRLTKAQVAAALGHALDDETTVFSELGVPLSALPRRTHRSWFQEPHSGGLGWAFPAAMGAKLAAPDRVVVATMGDGSYIFANPTACHQIAEALGLALLVVVVNNAEWGAVRASVAQLYPEGMAAKTNAMPLTGLAPSPDFCQTAQASRAWARRVERAEELDAAIADGLAAVADGRLALLDVQVEPD
ncbi:acetolactate synthase-1/2/3 large subunit [Rhodovulum iodosum]|uniref:Acetolactate synthase-1/2/3 large subunit n=1 Tax=Rhodovulum iodosum TaxID=68291 RepID=A0ABV3XX83_9RHOB|nr:thiamine pyrophosphate-requiring protein [Rhodovulum robiginosum]RSK34054.1 thiamine pyrophosphate-requiring protein [Rhodovulum robiginosum]